MKAALTRVIGWLVALEIGLDEVVLVIALTLITVALWPTFGRAALLLPGLVLLWLALPARRAFIDKSDEKPAARRKH
jgi:hypothetical protein